MTSVKTIDEIEGIEEYGIDPKIMLRDPDTPR